MFRTFNVIEEDWDNAVSDGDNHCPCHCVLWQALVREDPALINDRSFAVGLSTITMDSEHYTADIVGQDLIRRFDYRNFPHGKGKPENFPITFTARKW